MLSTSRKPGDVFKDGKLDLKDYAVIASEFGKTGATVADVAGQQGLGMPDGKVDYRDLQAFLSEMTGHTLIIKPGENIEGFETGDFSKFPWSKSSGAYWTVAQGQAYSGNYSAKAGTIGNNERTSLELQLACKAGDITFYRKVSSEQGWDLLRFSIDGMQVAQWSGEQDWQKASYPVIAGTRKFKWGYCLDRQHHIPGGMNRTPVGQLGVTSSFTSYSKKRVQPSPDVPVLLQDLLTSLPGLRRRIGRRNSLQLGRMQPSAPPAHGDGCARSSTPPATTAWRPTGLPAAS